MYTKEINGIEVTFREKIPARFGWSLLGPMNRLSKAFEKRRAELLAQLDEPIEGDVIIPGDEVVEIVQQTLSFAEVTSLIRGAVEAWGFPADLTKDSCCDDLDALDEVFPLFTESRKVFFGMNLRGEAAGGPTNT